MFTSEIGITLENILAHENLFESAAREAAQRGVGERFYHTRSHGVEIRVNWISLNNEAHLSVSWYDDDGHRVTRRKDYFVLTPAQLVRSTFQVALKLAEELQEEED